MTDFFQNGTITTIHDLGVAGVEELEERLEEATRAFPLGLVLPVTASDMRAAPFERIVSELAEVSYLDRIVVTLGLAPTRDDLRQTLRSCEPLGERARVLWTDGPRIREIYATLEEAGLRLGDPGKGRQVWTAFALLLAESRIHGFALHDCDIVNYRRGMLARLCLPLARPGFDFDFVKAYYSRFGDRLYGRVSRLLVTPLLRALKSVVGPLPFLEYLDSFRYPLSGEFAISAKLARSNRISCDWGLEIGSLAEVWRNTSPKRVCQVDLCRRYEHKHQSVSLQEPDRGLQKMALHVLTTLLRTLASMGVSIGRDRFRSLRSAYVRAAQDAVRQFHADAVMNALEFDRHLEEATTESFARQIEHAGELFERDPLGHCEIPNLMRAIAAFPELPRELEVAVEADHREA